MRKAALQYAAVANINTSKNESKSHLFVPACLWVTYFCHYDSLYSYLYLPGANVYAFGSKWPDDGQLDHYFFLQPSVGIHDIHMNQGDTVQRSANGIFQDGALLIYYPDEKRWVGMFLRFQSQSIHTDEYGNLV